MKFLLDENMPFSAMKMLKEKGHNAEHIRKTSLVGSTDSIIAEYAKNQKAVLITKDIEFGSPLLYPADAHYGLIVLRLPYFFSAQQITSSLKEFIDAINPEELINSRIIIQAGRYRKKKM